jgi:iron(III) transport system ATP-binding protein
METVMGLNVEHLTKIFANTTDAIAGGVRDVSFNLKDGTFFTLLGPSGCGKTTTLRCIAGLERPDEAVVQLGSRTIFDHRSNVSVPMNLRNFGMVFQSYAIWPHMTVFENVAFPLRVAKGRKNESDVKAAVERALATVDLAGFGTRPATRLSGGQQQRVALARAIVSKPDLLLLDEPLSNLDAALRVEMRKELKRLQREIGITTIYVTHDQSEALELSDTIAVMNLGRVVQMGSSHDIYFRPRDKFVASFVGSTNLLAATAEKGIGQNEVAAVRLADGTLVNCLFTAGRSAAEPVSISIRPEAISLVPSGGSVGEGVNRIAGTVSSKGFLGNMNRYSLDVGGQTLSATTNPELDLPIGAQVSLVFTPSSAIALPG